jgi:hypothetical protein
MGKKRRDEGRENVNKREREGSKADGAKVGDLHRLPSLQQSKGTTHQHRTHP